MQGYAITINGETHNQSEWCRIYKIDPSTVRSRMERGMTFEEALTKKGQRGRVRRNPPERVGTKEPANLAGTKKIDNAKCKKCGYGGKTDGDTTCDYILREGHRRPCPPGSKCTASIPKGTSKASEAQKAMFKAAIFGR